MNKKTKSGKALKETGIQSAVDNAESNMPGWSEIAFQYLKKFIRYYPDKIFLAEDVRNWAYRKGLIVPPNHRAWGGVISRAKKEAIIKFAGYKQVKNPKAHCANAAAWQRVVV